MRPPARKGRRTFMCRICGYTIPKKEVKNKNKLDCCGKLVHLTCWDIAVPAAKIDAKRCENIMHLLEKDGSVLPVKKNKPKPVYLNTVSVFGASLRPAGVPERCQFRYVPL